MKHEDKTKEEFVQELVKLRQRIAQLERSEIQRKRAEKVLRKNENKLRNIISFSPDAITISDLKGKIIDCNQATLDLHGFSSKKELIGKNAFDLIAPKDREKAAEKLKETLEQGNVKNIEYTFLTKDGAEFPAELAASFIQDSSGQPEFFVAITKDISERKQREEQLYYLATHDALTGLPNRVLFNDRLSLALYQANRSQQRLAVMLIDLDNFKEVNDTLGHRTGDKLLQAVGERIKNLLRKSDTVARMGGDEFLLLLPGICRIDDVATVAQKILDVFQEPFMVKDHKLHITTSIGIAIFPHHGKDDDTLIKNADIAMYRAKRYGRNSYQYYTRIVEGEPAG
jgi:diguanylate cyclase (GGDEF)-like protein/PAS domain S-box-containing protein